MTPMDSATATYARRFPAALLPPAAALARRSDAGAPAHQRQFHAYSVKFTLLEAGGDPLQQRQAADFLLLVPVALDQEASNMVLQLHLPLGASAEARVQFRAVLALSDDQEKRTKHFNLWLFNVILGRQSAAGDPEDGPKGYYVLPLSTEAEGGIDWSTVDCALSSGLDCSRKAQHAAGGVHHSCEIDCMQGDSDLPVEGQVRMWSGDADKDLLYDAMVTCALNGMVFYVVDISDSNGGSSVPQKTCSACVTVAEHYRHRYHFKLRRKEQPLLSCRKLSCAASYLRSQGRCAELLLGGNFSKQMEIVQLPPEICVLHVGLKAKLLRGALRLPTVLYSLEKALLAAELRDRIGISMSTFKVLRALTPESCQGGKSYESLELLGDSVLKIAGATYLYTRDMAMDYETLGDEMYELVKNKTLYHFALGRKLQEYVFADIFTPRGWIPPGPLHASASDVQSCLTATQRLSYKTLADIVEALVGAYLLHGGFKAALHVMAWLEIPISFPPARTLGLDVCSSGTMSGILLSQLTDVQKLQSKLGYRFQNLHFLAAALHYVPAEPGSVFVFQRLEFLGDAVLHFLVTRHFVSAHPDLEPGKLNDLKQATVNSENYASVVVRNGLHVNLQQVSPVLEDEILTYVIDFCQENGASRWSSFGLSSQTSPKVVGDIFQTMAAAIFLDSGFNAETVWKVLRPFLEPLVTPDTVILQPVRQLEKICHEHNWRLDMDCVCLSGMVIARAVINDVPCGVSKHQEKRVARRLAAAKALLRLGTGLKLANTRTACTTALQPLHSIIRACSRSEHLVT